MAQSLLVAVLVSGCAGYAVWTLMPAGWRRRLATALLKLPLPAVITTTLQRAARPANGCGCDGCDQAPTKAAAAGAPQPITLHRRLKR